MADTVRVRFAPSPTGYLHVGGARTALFNYLFAKKHGGKFILRIEDTDQERSTEESLRMQISDLKWLGLDWDEGPDAETLADVGEFGPYRQSQRLEIYGKYVDQLLAEGKAFYCFMTEAEIDKQREELKAKGLPLQVKSPYRDLSLADAKAKIEGGESAVVRFRTPDTKTDYVHEDIVRGEVKLPSDMVGDFVLVRAGGMPVYNFVCAVDDALMKITHVFRGEDHLSNTMRQTMVLEALGFDLPKYGHMSMILGPDKQKLSKRHGDTSCFEYKAKGYLPHALLNFIALLGWSHPDGEETFSFENLKEKFSAERLNPAPAVFDETKLKWVNSVHLRGLPGDQLWSELQPFLTEAGLKLSGDADWKSRALELFKPYMEILSDSVGLFSPLDDSRFAIQEEAADALSWESTKAVLEKWVSILESHSGDYLSEDDFGAAQNQIKQDCSVKGKHLFMPIRVAIIGKPHGAELKILVPLMKKESLQARAKQAIERIG